MLEIAGVTLTRGRAALLDNFSLSFPDPGAYLICGAVGSGKSVLARMVAGRLQPESGRVSLDGSSIYLRSRGRSAETLFYTEYGEPMPSAEYIADYLDQEAWRSGVSTGAAAPYFDLLGQSVPGLARRRLESLSGGELALAQIALACAVPARVTAIDGQLNVLDNGALQVAARLIRLATQAQDRFVILTALRAAEEVGTLAGTVRLEKGLPIRLFTST